MPAMSHPRRHLRPVSRLGAPAAAPALGGEGHGLAGELAGNRLDDPQCLGRDGADNRGDSCCAGPVIVNQQGHEAHAAVRINAEQSPAGAAGVPGFRGHRPVISAFGAPGVSGPSAGPRWSRTTAPAIVICR